MPETNNENAKAVVYKVQERLLHAVEKKGWPVAFSAGVVTCNCLTNTLDELIAIAEDLMNTARETGKNVVKSRILEVSSTTA
jgi:PleD family two-component response regulator